MINVYILKPPINRIKAPKFTQNERIF